MKIMTVILIVLLLINILLISTISHHCYLAIVAFTRTFWMARGLPTLTWCASSLWNILL